jgi:hypothetical protein
MFVSLPVATTSAIRLAATIGMNELTAIYKKSNAKQTMRHLLSRSN